MIVKTHERYYSIPEAARLLGIKAYALRRAVNDGVIPAYKFNGSSRWLVKLSEVQAAITNLRAGGWDEA